MPVWIFFIPAAVIWWWINSNNAELPAELSQVLIIDRDRLFVWNSCGFISHLIGEYTIGMSKWNKSVHGFLIRTVTK